MIMRRLTAAEFIEKLKTAPAWTISRDDFCGEIQLTMRGENDEIEGYLGPNPMYGSLMDVMVFMFEVEALTRPTKSDVDLTLPRLNTDEFFGTMDSGVKWMTEFHELERCVELVILTGHAKIKRYLSKDLYDMTDIEAETFLSMLETMNKEKSND
jgi:hypothetical protein